MIFVLESRSGLLLSLESNVMPESEVEKFAQVISEKHPANIYFFADFDTREKDNRVTLDAVYDTLVKWGMSVGDANWVLEKIYDEGSE